MNSTVPYTGYDIRPRILDFCAGEDTDEIERTPGGRLVFRPSAKHKLPFSEIHIDEDEGVFDILYATFEGLLEDLVPGSEIAEKFEDEWSDFDPTANPLEDLSCGVWVYYPRPKHLVRYSSPFWHRLSLIMRNSMLQRDPEMQLAWPQLRTRMEDAVVAVAGCSIGSVALHAVVRDLRPLHIKVADCKAFHLTNANRVMLGYNDFGRNKAVVTAEQIHRIDPYIKISVYEEGIHEGNIRDFLAGDDALGEPATSVLIEEMDDIEMKIRMREVARELRIPVIMMTDVGSAAQLDVRRFDRSQNAPLIFGISDKDLYGVKDAFVRERTREAWYQFFVSVVGEAALTMEEFRRIILKEDPPLFGGAPQLGSTVMTASGIAAEAVARLVLGFPLRERMFINKHTGVVKIEGELI